MDLNQAISKHAEWKVRFRTAIQKKEQMNVTDIARDNCCDLGKWLHGDGRQQFGRLDSYKTCVATHAIFHTHAGRVAQTINAGRYSDAEGMLEGQAPYAQASNNVALAIRQLKKDAAL